MRPEVEATGPRMIRNLGGMAGAIAAGDPE